MSSPHGNERRPCTAPAPSPLPESKRGVQSWHLNFSPLVTVNKDVVDSRSPGGDEAEPKTSKNGTIEGSDKSRLDTNKSDATYSRDEVVRLPEIIDVTKGNSCKSMVAEEEEILEQALDLLQTQHRISESQARQIRVKIQGNDAELRKILRRFVESTNESDELMNHISRSLQEPGRTPENSVNWIEGALDCLSQSVFSVVSKLRHCFLWIQASVLDIEQPAGNAAMSIPSPSRDPTYPLRKIADQLRLGRDDRDSEGSKMVLVSSGSYCPMHLLHLRVFELAKEHLEKQGRYRVLGGIISPCHDTYVRAKLRNTPKEMIPPKHRLGIIEAAVAGNSWISVDKWEITRRRVLDYLSTLKHVKELLEQRFPEERFKLMYLCGVNTLSKLSAAAMKSEGFGAVIVGRPNEIDTLVRYLGSQWTGVAHLVEDRAILPRELEGTNSHRVRRAMIKQENLHDLVGKDILSYIEKNGISDKVAGRQKWSRADKTWRAEDQAYASDSPLNSSRARHEMTEDNLCEKCRLHQRALPRRAFGSPSRAGLPGERTPDSPVKHCKCP